MEIKCNHNNFDLHALNLLSCFPMWLSVYREWLKLLTADTYSSKCCFHQANFSK